MQRQAIKFQKLVNPVHQPIVVRTVFSWLAGALIVLGIFLFPTGAHVSSDGPLPVYVIQGEGEVSPYYHNRVDTFGVVTAVAPRGFYLQDPMGDGRQETSDGIFVYTSKRPTVKAGDCVLASGALVDEFYEKTELSKVKSIQPSALCGSTALLPVELPAAGLGQNVQATYERFEGMLVTVPPLGGVVQGPTKRYDTGDVEISLIPDRLAPYVTDGRVFQSESEEMAALVYLSGVLGAGFPDANQGDRVYVGLPGAAPRPAQAVLDYNFGKYQVMLLPGEQVQRIASPLVEEITAPARDGDFTICTFNLLGLGRGSAQYPEPNRYAQELQKRARTIAGHLQGCTIVGLQETGTPQDAEALAALLRDEFGLDYAAVAMPGPQSSSPEFPLTNSLLARRDRVKVVAGAGRQACSAVDYDVVAEVGACPDGQYALFDRPPLVVDVQVTGTWGAPYPLRVIVNHWKSKGGDETVNAGRRLAQAAFVAGLAQESLDADPGAHVVVLGDLNDYYGSAPVETLRSGTQPALVHLFDFLPEVDRYTYIFNGGSQTLDHVLISPALEPHVAEVQPVHVNADFAAPGDEAGMHHASDHDPVLVRVRPAGAAWLGGQSRLFRCQGEAHG